MRGVCDGDSDGIGPLDRSLDDAGAGAGSPSGGAVLRNRNATRGEPACDDG